MQFYQRSKANLAIPIVPMLDILTILLIFFITNSQWKKKNSGLSIALPQSRELAQSTLPAKALVLKVDAEGRCEIEGRSVDLQQLGDLLAAQLKNNASATFVLQADRRISLEKLIKIWEAFKQNNIAIAEVPTQLENTKAK